MRVSPKRCRPIGFDSRVSSFPGRSERCSFRAVSNAYTLARNLRKFCALDDAGERTLEMAVRRMGLSARAHDRILKLARTIADLDHAESVTAKHLAEAVQYRSLDRSYWS